MAENHQELAEKSRGDSREVTVTPRIDLLESEDELLLLADVPGVQPDNVDIRFENGELTVHGRRQPSHDDKKRAAWEYEVTNYFRSFRVTEQIAADKIAAELKNGVLTLRLPKVEAVKPRRIAVRG
ncbi:Hsp20/alpha crystallin family protein [Fimbriiglobus ruber]|uniref:Heat shock protein Hsp20 n=1 Tax=Fimbriiglobus ruber TaxID=1908690 RepID=A0A225D2W9_9BACT|nr:Hsp20/alpha crystallin family protein [Fimbriiglobus ruber]OWK35852.1 heat shock protein Hsp20 [Fimbriiglobus ruber]